ncbi:hypothetical protein KIN20_010658 [Parelaphostrongylus tenuis]|uniref:Uncharacterized protein n=1 Tax=Parelaphostrongylus tenuis TaxID=148309 RepID=A0AAD5MBU4_PARTN|nr:hypothetical protein KIN20_010658 [Parelaphostrongylus tenuis]
MPTKENSALSTTMTKTTMTTSDHAQIIGSNEDEAHRNVLNCNLQQLSSYGT